MGGELVRPMGRTSSAHGGGIMWLCGRGLHHVDPTYQPLGECYVLPAEPHRISFGEMVTGRTFCLLHSGHTRTL
jgi:hypothetical protein